MNVSGVIFSVKRKKKGSKGSKGGNLCLYEAILIKSAARKVSHGFGKVVKSDWHFISFSNVRIGRL